MQSDIVQSKLKGQDKSVFELSERSEQNPEIIWSIIVSALTSFVVFVHVHIHCISLYYDDVLRFILEDIFCVLYSMS